MGFVLLDVWSGLVLDKRRGVEEGGWGRGDGRWEMGDGRWAMGDGM